MPIQLQLSFAVASPLRTTVRVSYLLLITSSNNHLISATAWLPTTQYPPRLAFGTNTRDLSLSASRAAASVPELSVQSGGFRPVARCFGSAAAFALRSSLADDASPPGPSAASTGHPSACFLRVPIDITVIHINQTTPSEYSPYLCSIFFNYREDGRLGIKPNSEPSGSKARGQRPKG